MTAALEALSRHPADRRVRPAPTPAAGSEPVGETSPAPELSVVLPVHDEEPNLAELYRRLCAALANEPSFELVFVDDGSRDGSAVLLAELCRLDPRVRLIRLSRNFGHQAAMAAGLDHARGAAVVLMDSDLQDPPEVLPQMLAAWRAGADVVYAVRRGRKEHLLKRLAYRGFYRVIRRLSTVDLPADSGDFSLLDRRVADAVAALPEQPTYLRGLRSWVGFTQVPLPYERAARTAGRPTYGFRQLRKLAMDGIVGTSSLPLRLLSRLGAAVLTTSLLHLAVVLLAALAGRPLGAVAVLAGVAWFGGGVQLCALGLLGEYLARVYDEVKGRPGYVVASVAGGPEGSAYHLPPR
jgi:polyisoprenyl-phosphate glycosyltransferase